MGGDAVWGGDLGVEEEGEDGKSAGQIFEVDGGSGMVFEIYREKLQSCFTNKV